MNEIKVLLVDDHQLVRAGIRSLLSALRTVTVLGEAANGQEALQQIATSQPDVVLMDIAMPGMNGLEATAKIVRDFPQVKVIMLSMNATEEHIMQALRMGASGYILKDAEPSELERAILSVCNGETYLSPVIGTRLADYVRRLGSRTAPGDRLTPRQREVLQLIAEGWTTKEIAHQLKISVKTAETHRTQLMDNLDIHEVAGLVRYAIRTGLVSSD